MTLSRLFLLPSSLHLLLVLFDYAPHQLGRFRVLQRVYPGYSVIRSMVQFVLGLQESFQDVHVVVRVLKQLTLTHYHVCTFLHVMQLQLQLLWPFLMKWGGDCS